MYKLGNVRARVYALRMSMWDTPGLWCCREWAPLSSSTSGHVCEARSTAATSLDFFFLEGKAEICIFIWNIIFFEKYSVEKKESTVGICIYIYISRCLHAALYNLCFRIYSVCTFTISFNLECAYKTSKASGYTSQFLRAKETGAQKYWSSCSSYTAGGTRLWLFRFTLSPATSQRGFRGRRSPCSHLRGWRPSSPTVYQSFTENAWRNEEQLRE